METQNNKFEKLTQDELNLLVINTQRGLTREGSEEWRELLTELKRRRTKW